MHGVRTDRGDVECERVLLCAGIWGPTVGAFAGVPIPLVAVQHQLVWTDPIPELEVRPARWCTRSCGTRTWRCTSAIARTTTPSATTTTSRSSRLSELRGVEPMPSLMPFTPGDFEVAEAEAARLLPALKGRMRPTDPERSINGMSRSRRTRARSWVSRPRSGAWICEAVGSRTPAGSAHVAEWMVRGEPSIDMAEAARTASIRI